MIAGVLLINRYDSACIVPSCDSCHLPCCESAFCVRGVKFLAYPLVHSEVSWVDFSVRCWGSNHKVFQEVLSPISFITHHQARPWLVEMSMARLLLAGKLRGTLMVSLFLFLIACSEGQACVISQSRVSKAGPRHR